MHAAIMSGSTCTCTVYVVVWLLRIYSLLPRHVSAFEGATSSRRCVVYLQLHLLALLHMQSHRRVMHKHASRRRVRIVFWVLSYTINAICGMHSMPGARRNVSSKCMHRIRRTWLAACASSTTSVRCMGCMREPSREYVCLPVSSRKRCLTPAVTQAVCHVASGDTGWR